ncbi:MAG: hypothetical protein ACK2T4_04225 [Candidatus Promineifilaceae bacterium]|jgi:hypothetical protein
MSYKWVNASELSEYLYCRRAWWYKNIRSLKSANVQRMQYGSKFHATHNRRVRRLPWMRGFAYVLIFLAVLISVFQLVLGS